MVLPGLCGHLDGTVPKSALVVAGETATAEETGTYSKELVTWNDQEAIARHMLFHAIPNIHFLRRSTGSLQLLRCGHVLL